MLIAKETAKSNIGEYLIYMYQIEDLIRACNFVPEQINKSLVSQYDVDEELRIEIKNWYLGLAELMIEEKLEEMGHLSFMKNKMTELFDFHLFLLENPEHKDYKRLYQKTEPAIIEFATKQKDSNKNTVELIVDAIYAFYLLRLKKEEITEGTQQSIGAFSVFLKLLSDKFIAYERGELKVFDE